MRTLLRLPVVLLASVALLLGCDSNPFEPALEAGSLAAARGGGQELAAPSNVSAAGSAETRIEVRWQDNSSNETGFVVQRSTSGETGLHHVVATTDANIVAYGDSELGGGAHLKSQRLSEPLASGGFADSYTAERPSTAGSTSETTSPALVRARLASASE